jgi:hypothetical protein
MEKYYQPIDGKNITFDKYVIAEVFGAAGEVIASRDIYFGKGIDKYAFYNTGELCEVRVEDGRQTICVNCYGNRRKDVLNWLKTYLTNGMKAYGWETDIVEDKDDYFYAAFYQEDAE